jgi:predicted DNA-binding transcriptional regulator YafY
MSRAERLLALMQSHPGLAHAAGDALGKIAAVPPRERAAALDWPALLVGSSLAGEAEAAALPVVRAALARERKLGFGYADKAGRETKRVVWPVALGFFNPGNGNWDDFRLPRRVLIRRPD